MPEYGLCDMPPVEEEILPLLSTEPEEILPPPIAYSYSDTQFEIIKKHILDFQASLDNGHDVGLMLTNFGKSMLMEVTEIGYEESVLMVFRGYVNGNKATLIQHISQLNFLLTAIPKAPDKPRNTIGFTAKWGGTPSTSP